MYKTCPKCQYKRKASDPEPANECPACHINFKIWMKQRFKQEKNVQPAFSPAQPPASFQPPQLCMEDRSYDSMRFYAQCFFWFILLIWGWQLMNTDYFYYSGSVRIDIIYPELNNGFIHSINLVFHEAGHIIFSPFGRFMAVLGGSLMQLLIPLAVMLTFLIKENNPFSAGVGLWWLGESFIDLAPYINDARAGQIPLLGGTTGADSPGYHDWTNILGDLGWLASDHQIADRFDNFGGFLMLLALAWMACILITRYKTP